MYKRNKKTNNSLGISVRREEIRTLMDFEKTAPSCRECIHARLKNKTQSLEFEQYPTIGYCFIGAYHIYEKSICSLWQDIKGNMLQDGKDIQTLKDQLNE